MVSAEFASIDPSGRLVIHESTSASDVLATQLQELATDKDLTTLPFRTSTTRKMRSEFPSCLDDATPSLPVKTWLDYYQVNGSWQHVFKKLEARRQKSRLSGLRDEDLGDHLDNSVCWLEKVAGAVTLLQEMRKEHVASLKADSVLPVGRMPSGLLAEWAGSEAVSILAEALPQLVDQVDLYEETLAARGRCRSNEQSLQVEISRLQDQLKAEKRQREYYWKKLRELQQAKRSQHLGMEPAETSDIDDDMAMYTEKDMQALRDKMRAQMEALDKEWQERLEAERRRNRLSEESLRNEIEELRAQLEAALARAAQFTATGGRGRADTGEDAGDAQTSEGASLPTITADSGKGKAAQDRGRSADQGPQSSPGGQPTGGGQGLVRQTGPNGDRTGRSGSSLLRAQSGSDREMSPDIAQDPTATGSTSKRPRPSTAPGSSSTQEDPPRFIANRYTPSASEDDQRRLTEEMKRRVFESVLAQERKRQDEFDEQEQNALAARWELQGQAELVQLLRRVDDQALRRDLFRLLKTYCKRSPQAMEIVCVYCRRKPRADQIHSFDTPSRPASAGRLGMGASNVSLVGSQASMTPATGLPRVSSSPSITMGTNKSGARATEEPALVALENGRLEPRRGRPPKLVAMMPTTPGLRPSPSPGVFASGALTGSTPIAPRTLDLEPPQGWATVDAAS